MLEGYAMKVCILMGSPRAQGNTAALLAPFTEQLESCGAQVTRFDLYEKNLQPCLACRACQKDWTIFGCARKDDTDKGRSIKGDRTSDHLHTTDRI